MQTSLSGAGASGRCPCRLSSCMQGQLLPMSGMILLVPVKEAPGSADLPCCGAGAGAALP